MTLGLVIGKFMPPTYGHKYVVEYGRRCVSRLVVLVSSVRTKNEIPLPIRYEWLKRHFSPEVEVVAMEDAGFSDLNTFQFAVRWKEQVIDLLGSRPDVLIASERYVHSYALVLGCRAMLVDRGRFLVPISATQVRTKWAANWDMILPEARSYFVQRIGVICDDPELTRLFVSVARESLRFTVITTREIARVRRAWDVTSCAERYAAMEAAAMEVARVAVVTCLTRDEHSLCYSSDFNRARARHTVPSHHRHPVFVELSPDRAGGIVVRKYGNQSGCVGNEAAEARLKRETFVDCIQSYFLALTCVQTNSRVQCEPTTASISLL